MERRTFVLALAVALGGCVGEAEPLEAQAVPVIVQMTLFHDMASAGLLAEAEVANVGDAPLHYESACQSGVRFVLFAPDGEEARTTARPCGDLALRGVVPPNATATASFRFDGRLWNGSAHVPAPPGEYVLKALFEAREGPEGPLATFEGVTSFDWQAPAGAPEGYALALSIPDDEVAPGETAWVFANVTNVGDAPFRYVPSCEGAPVAFSVERGDETVIPRRACEAPPAESLAVGATVRAAFTWDAAFGDEPAPDGVYVVTALLTPEGGEPLAKRVALTVSGGGPATEP